MDTFVIEEQLVKHNPQFCEGGFKCDIATKVHKMLVKRSEESLVCDVIAQHILSMKKIIQITLRGLLQASSVENWLTNPVESE